MGVESSCDEVGLYPISVKGLRAYACGMNETESVVETFQVRPAIGVRCNHPQQSGLTGQNPRILDCGTSINGHGLSNPRLRARIRLCAETGVFWGAIWGLMLGCAFFQVPGKGPLVAACGGAVLLGGVNVAGGVIYNYCIRERDLSQDVKEPEVESFVSGFEGPFFSNFQSDEKMG